MSVRLQILISALSPRWKGRLWKIWYQFISYRYQWVDWTFMNYGYADLDSNQSPLALQPADEPDRCYIQLYHHIVGALDLLQAKVLEVGSGRGGGCSYIARYLQPASVCGVDYSKTAIAFSQRVHQATALIFLQGDASSLPFDSNTFDIVINVESSHCYPSMEQFLNEAFRVLRPGGHFLWADIHASDMIDCSRKQFEQTGFTLLCEEDITPNVVRALDLTSERKMELIRQHVPRFLIEPFAAFAGVPGTRIYEEFRFGKATYLYRLLRKDEA
jgi:ubiquinone/menaquinone biosynthesis C-methylase UbiE